MKKLLFGSVAFVALISANAASAADMGWPVKGRMLKPEWNWSGFYAGLNAGYARGTTVWNDLDGSLNGVAITRLPLVPFHRPLPQPLPTISAGPKSELSLASARNMRSIRAGRSKPKPCMSISASARESSTVGMALSLPLSTVAWRRSTQCGSSVPA